MWNPGDSMKTPGDSMRNEWGGYTEILMDSMDSTRIPQGFHGMDGIHEEYVGECKLLDALSI